MVQILPFRGIRYAGSYVDATTFSPPFDVISPQERRRYFQSNPYNVVRLTLGPREGDCDWYPEAARTLRRWLDAGVLCRDKEPRLYGYEQHFDSQDGRRAVRSGFFCRVQLCEWRVGIYPHERTRVGPRADRLCLTRAMRANMSPVFGLYRDPGREIGRRVVSCRAPEVDVLDREGVRHVLWPVAEADVIASVADLMTERHVVIADGHHRYETALAYRAERRAAEGDPAEARPYDYVLMYLTAIEDPGLEILATHRVVHADMPLDPQGLLRALQSVFSVEACDGAESLAREVAKAGGETVAIGLCLGAGGHWVLRLRDREAAHRAADHVPRAQSELDVCVLQNLILEPHLGLSAETLATSDQVEYTIDATEACARVRDSSATAAFILNPTALDQVWDAAVSGLTMPQKSTYFYPKLLTGLVFHPLDTEASAEGKET